MGRNRKRVQGLSTIPLCREHHTLAHHGHAATIDALVDRAPAHWKREGTWSLFEETFWTWVERRQMLQRWKGGRT